MLHYFIDIYVTLSSTILIKMKKIYIVISFIIINSSFAQKQMTTRTGTVHFEASVPLFESVAAVNKNASCTLNLKSGQITSVVPMKEFRFKLNLMEEHFNKKYLETVDYPKASFEGTITEFNLGLIDDFGKEFEMTGELKIYGKTKKIDTVVILRKLKNKIQISANFNVKLKDFNIEIPEMLSMKIAEIVNIKSEFFLH